MCVGVTIQCIRVWGQSTHCYFFGLRVCDGGRQDNNSVVNSPEISVSAWLAKEIQRCGIMYACPDKNVTHDAPKTPFQIKRRGKTFTPYPTHHPKPWSLYLQMRFVACEYSEPDATSDISLARETCLCFKLRLPYSRMLSIYMYLQAIYL